MFDLTSKARLLPGFVEQWETLVCFSDCLMCLFLQFLYFLFVFCFFNKKFTLKGTLCLDWCNQFPRSRPYAMEYYTVDGPVMSEYPAHCI